VPIGVVAELEMAEDVFDAFIKGDGRLRVDGVEVFMLLVSPAGPGPDDEVGLEEEEGAIGCAIGT
jgi:hypothetical protein